MIFLWIVSGLLSLAYISLMLLYFYGWRRSLRQKSGHQVGAEDRPQDMTEPPKGVSIVIPLRNEAGNLRKLIPVLSEQDYPAERFEVIMVDDHSEDESAEIIRSSISGKDNFILLEQDAEKSGKKDALHKGILASRFPVILNTDADCRPGKHWISEMTSGMEDENVRMQMGAVIIENRKGFLYALQMLEMQSLTFVSAGSAGIGDPILCNAANLAYHKSDYLDFNKEHKRVSESGDDVFLLHWLKKRKGTVIRFMPGSRAAVRTPAALGLGAFLRQRIRWASKTFLLPDLHFLVSALSVYGMNLLIFGLLLSLILQGIIPGFVRFEVLATLISVFSLKTLADLLVLLPVLKHFQLNNYSWYLLPAEFLYFAYVSLVGMLSQIVNVRWKGRKL